MTGNTSATPAFYLPENPDYTILASAIDSARYAVAATTLSAVGANAQSFLMDVNGKPVRTGGRLIQGIGYCADAPFGAVMLFRLGQFTGRTEFAEAATQIAHHAIHGGYLEDPDLPVRLYRDAESGEFFDQVEARSAYLDLGHMAKAVHNLLKLSELVGADDQERLMKLGARFGRFVLRSSRTRSGWMPRRVSHDLKIYRQARLPPQAGLRPTRGLYLDDPVAETSGAGLLTIACMLHIDQLGCCDAKEFLAETCEAFVAAGGHFGSVNTDTEDPAESVSFALAFQVLLDVGKHLDRPDFRDFAYQVCLPGLARFSIVDNLSGLKTKGLLRLSDSYTSACLWECSEAALAYLRAGQDRGEASNVLKGLTILRAIGRNHIGGLGFLPSEIDWDGRMPAASHVGQQPIGPRAVTHPYMNNLHIVAATLFYLQNMAWVVSADGESVFLDAQGSRLWPMK